MGSIFIQEQQLTDHKGKLIVVKIGMNKEKVIKICYILSFGLQRTKYDMIPVISTVGTRPSITVSTTYNQLNQFLSLRHRHRSQEDSENYFLQWNHEHFWRKIYLWWS